MFHNSKKLDNLINFYYIYTNINSLIYKRVHCGRSGEPTFIFNYFVIYETSLKYMSEKEISIKKANKIDTFSDLMITAQQLSLEISLFLNKEIEDLNISSHVFKSGLERYIHRVLNSLVKNEQQIMIFPESIPGFTLMVYKKIEIVCSEKTTIKKKRNPSEELQQASAIDNVVSHFFDKNKQQVLIIENNDILFALFPVKDTKKNLKDMGLYITY